MADVAIRASATAAVPRDYTIPGAQELLPKTVFASLDGTAAGSPWLPCLQVLDPGGNVMFSAVANTTVAAGVSVDVSWFPGVIPATAGGGGGGGGNWTKVFEHQVLAASTETTIDTGATVFSNYTNDIFVAFVGSSESGIQPDSVKVQFNGNIGGHHFYDLILAQGGGSPLPIYGEINTLQNAGRLTHVDNTGGAVMTYANAWIPKVASGGNYSGLNSYSSMSNGVGQYATTYNVGDIHRLTLTLNSGAFFGKDTRFTVWTI